MAAWGNEVSVGDGSRTRTDVGATTRPSFIDVFAGCGGLSLGLKRAGWRGLFAIEKDPFAFETLSANFPVGDGPLSYDWPEDIEHKAWNISELLESRADVLAGLADSVDLLAGGPPCQGFSHAGRRRPEDPRNRLFEAYLELVRVLRPKVVLLENVRGFTSGFDPNRSEGIGNFADTLKDRLDPDYLTASAIIRASDFGVPQSRARFFLVGLRRGTGDPERVARFFEDLAASRDAFLTVRKLPRRPTTWDAISDLEVGPNGTIPCPDCKGFEAISYSGPRSEFQIAMRDGHDGRPGDTRLARHRSDIRERFAAIIRSANEEGRLNVSISPETRRLHGLKKMAIRVLDPLAPAPTITSLPDDLLHYSEPRTLTVRENARLQSFPDWFAFKGKYTTGGERRAKEVPRFTQVANAVPPLLAEQIGLGLARLLGDEFGRVPLERYADLAERLPLDA
ncbi:DNA cytosine methyltransferase [Sphingomonas sanguinis]|uniref:DNA cytosine methyltransferase n=1 Tax=Sphingomonas sanguinis TaxID=33051 RepID=UPI001C599EEA|nr:DNA cytosine methyltransferase [Sphingomonas sanguinis]QXT35389.1 DNA cytosine methyltransferase [Sphingomonas sanguinis]